MSHYENYQGSNRTRESVVRSLKPKPGASDRRRFQRIRAYGVATARPEESPDVEPLNMPVVDVSAGGLLAVGVPPFSESRQGSVTVGFPSFAPLSLSASFVRMESLDRRTWCWAAQFSQPSEEAIAKCALSVLLQRRGEANARPLLLCTKSWERQQQLARALLQADHSVVLAPNAMSAIGWLVDDSSPVGAILVDETASGFKGSAFLRFLRMRFPNHVSVVIPKEVKLSRWGSSVGLGRLSNAKSDWATCSNCGSLESASYRAGATLCMDCLKQLGQADVLDLVEGRAANGS